MAHFPTALMHRLVRLRRPLLALVLAMTGGCQWLHTGNPAAFRPQEARTMRTIGACGTTCRDSLDIVAMGVSGYLIIPWRDTTQLVMTPPSYTNPTLWWMALGDWWLGSSPDRARVTRRLRDIPAAGPERLARVRAILVGHGHYDHLMDLPPLAPLLHNATVYGSRTVAHLLAPTTLRTMDIDSLTGTDAQHPGRSFAVGDSMSSTIRVRAIEWEHAPNISNLTIADEDQHEPRRRLPRSVHGWKKGRVLAYAIDVGLRADSVDVRLFMHDAAASPDVIRRAAAVLNTMPEARHTIAIIAAANFDQAHAYPDILLAHLAPEHVILGHWEDFFRSPEKSPRIVRGIKGRELVRVVERFQGARWTALAPGATLRLRF